jgi:HEXXH motif-containing protein
VILPPLTDRALAELGGIGGGPDTLALLVRDQDTRRMLLLRAILEAADAAGADVCPPAASERLRVDWALLEAAEAAYGPADASAVRTALCRPLLGPWARRCLQALTAPPGRASGADREQRGRELAADLAHFSAVAAAVAARAGVPFAVRLDAHGGALALPSLGALSVDGSGPVALDVVHRHGRLTLSRPGAADVHVFLEDGFGAWSDSRAWHPAYALPALLPDGPPLPLEDFDPYRAAPGDPQCYGLTGPATLDDGERKNWLQAWSGTPAALLPAGEQRPAEAATLLRCLVPLATPDRATAEARRGSCSATRSEAFGAVLSSTPPDATRLAATLVHELHHAKLAVVSEMVTLHHADDRARYFAPWRPDPRPYDGLLQGAYAHLALADFHQRRALDGSDRAHLDTDWSQFARYHAQVGAALPALVGSGELTPPGRRLVECMVDAHARMADHPAPRAHAVRALEYVRTARRLWARRVPQELRAPLA